MYGGEDGGGGSGDGYVAPPWALPHTASGFARRAEGRYRGRAIVEHPEEWQF